MSEIIGYTTVEQAYTSKGLSGLELAKRDLLNHFHIRKGEKWTNPTFGCNLPLYVFEPLDDDTIESIREEVFAVVREVSKRTTGLRHFDVQLVGGIILHKGMINFIVCLEQLQDCQFF